MLKTPKLQLALDFVSLEEALRTAGLCKEYVDIIEAGTPLIKSEGMKAVKTLRKMFPDKLIAADLKIMDTGFLEAELAFKSGADIVSVLGVADDETIRGAVKAARRYGKKAMCDLINHPSIEKRIKDLEGFGVNYILVHTGIDQQAKGKNPLTMLEKLAKSTKVPLAVAGGLDKDMIHKAIKSARILIVGGSITRAEYPGKSAKEIREVINENV